MTPNNHDKGYQICKRCIMDTSDPHIEFDEFEICNYCLNFETVIKPNWDTGEDGMSTLLALAKKIKADGEDKEFDCIIGLSGGLDSSYTAYIAVEKLGLIGKEEAIACEAIVSLNFYA